MMKSKASQMTRLALLTMTGWACFGAVAHADVDVPQARIVRIGMDPSVVGASNGIMVQLEDIEGVRWQGARQFYLSAAVGNLGTATMLTAFSMGQSVYVVIGGTAESGSLISAILVNAPAS